MAYSFQTFTVGQVLTAAQTNQVEVNIRDHVHGVDGVSMATRVAFIKRLTSFSTGASPAATTFDTEIFDTGSFYNTASTGAIFIPQNGIYLVTFRATTLAELVRTREDFKFALEVNSTTELWRADIWQNVTSGNVTRIELNATFVASATDILRLMNQDFLGGGLSIASGAILSINQIG
jgi:hypothetical protein